MRAVHQRAQCTLPRRRRARSARYSPTPSSHTRSRRNSPNCRVSRSGRVYGPPSAAERHVSVTQPLTYTDRHTEWSHCALFTHFQNMRERNSFRAGGPWSRFVRVGSIWGLPKPAGIEAPGDAGRTSRRIPRPSRAGFRGADDFGPPSISTGAAGDVSREYTMHRGDVGAPAVLHRVHWVADPARPIRSVPRSVASGRGRNAGSARRRGSPGPGVSDRSSGATGRVDRRSAPSATTPRWTDSADSGTPVLRSGRTRQAQTITPVPSPHGVYCVWDSAPAPPRR